MLGQFSAWTLVMSLFLLGCGSSGDAADNSDTTGVPDMGVDVTLQNTGPEIDAGTSTVDRDAPECTDRIDNDGDGLIDLDDPGCDDARDNREKETQCADMIDNDGDMLIDSFDPGCGSPQDDNEENPPLAAQCADGRDNDANGLVDEQDPGCSSINDDTERFGADQVGEQCNGPRDCADGQGCRSGRCLPTTPQCYDLIDNDQDGVIDFPLEPGCSTAGDNDEADPDPVPDCGNGLDDDDDGRIDYPEDPGCFGVGDSTEQDKTVTPACADQQDNDRDGRIDFPDDLECMSASDASERGSCLNRYDPPSITSEATLTLNSADGVFETEGTCGGTGSPEKVVYYRLAKDVEALVISTANPGTRAASTIYVRYRDCLSTSNQVELACAVEAAGTQIPGQTVRIAYPRKGDYFIVVDGVSGAGGIVELSVTEVALPECLNGEDDDGDGLTDYPSDPGCVRPDDREEADPATLPLCANGADDDSDGEIDFPNDPGCVAAAWPTENDSCGPGVRINEYPFGQSAVFGDTSDANLTAIIEPNSATSCNLSTGLRNGLREMVYLYRNPYRARLIISTAHPETRGNTAVYVRKKCGDATTVIACNDGNPNGMNNERNQGSVALSGVEPGNYYIIVDTKFGVGGKFKLSIESSFDEPECADHIDNDRDGKIDDDDPGCSAPRDRSESTRPNSPQCDDGMDNDGDGFTDYPFDPGCAARGDTNEATGEIMPACSNGIDDDLDGFIDGQDPGCTSRGDDTEQDLRIAPACNNGRDDDGDGVIDFPSDPDCQFAGGRSESQ